MGSCQSTAVRQQNLFSKRIDRSIARDKHTSNIKIKILLLGPSECGKSTFLKQLQIIHLEGFSMAEIEQRRPVIYSNLMEAAVALMTAMKNLEIEVDNQENHVFAQKILEFTKISKGRISTEIYLAIKSLLEDKAVQRFKKDHSTCLHDSEKYYLAHLDRIASSDYLPNNEDILRTRISTTGVSDLQFIAQKTEFHVFDVGGQRSERKKWIHYFDNVDAVTFIVAISEYDQVCVEDNSTNRMVESMLLFSWICNHENFKKIPMVVFFNKSDLFQETVDRVSLNTVFADFQGTQTYQNCLKFIIQLFEGLNKRQKALFTHVTCATNTQQVQMVTSDVFDTIIQKNLKHMGI